MKLGIFLTHKVIPCTFLSLLKVALGKQGIYLLLRISITRNLSLKNSKFPLFFCILYQFSSVYMDILPVKPIFFWKLGLCTARLKQTKGWIFTSVLSIIFTHIWPQNMLLSLNTVLSNVIFKSLQSKSLNHVIKVLILKTSERSKISRVKMFQTLQCPKLRS